MFQFLTNRVRRKTADSHTLTAAPDSCPDWTRDDAIAYKAFCRTPSGRVWVIRMRARVLNITSTACMGHRACDGKVYTPEEASGMCHMLNWLSSLSAVAAVQSDNSDTENESPQTVDPESLTTH